MATRTTVLGIAVLLLAGCASTPDNPGDASGSPAPSAAASGNGTVYTASWDTSAGTRTVTGYPIAADGSLGDPAELLSGPADDTDFPGVVDGVGPLALTGDYSDYWTTDVAVRSEGKVTSEAPAPRWCGGEGLTTNLCTLLDSTRVARTSDLGGDPEAGEGPAEGSIIVSSLEDGSTLKELGPFPGLSMMLGTGSPDAVLIVTSPTQSEDAPSVASTVQRLDLTDGTTTEIGVSPAGWVPLCPIGSDSVLGFPADDVSGSAVVVGPAKVGDVTWDQKDTIVGCSADGQFLYLQRIPQPPGEEVDDLEAPNPATSLQRITLADGSSSDVLVLDPGVLAGPVTR
jgi:hypothetical protein